MKTYEINSIQSIKDFFQSLYTDHNLLLDLDLPFADYTTEENVPCFDKEQAEYLDKIMVECFEWCEANKLDVHEIGFDIQVAEFKKRGFYPADFEFETA